MDMKTNAVPFQDLAKGMPYIKAKSALSYIVCQKNGDESANIYGSNQTVKVHKTDMVFPLRESHFGLINLSTLFLRVKNDPAGMSFRVPEDVLSKKGTHHAEHIDISIPFGNRGVPLDKSEIVICLGDAFDFENKTSAKLRI